MQINKINNQNFKGLNLGRVLQENAPKAKQYKFIKEDCYKLSAVLDMPASKLVELTEGADLKQFTFLKSMVNKFNKQRFHSMKKDDPEHILNIYSIVEKPTAMHINIVSKSNDSFEFLEKIFSLAKDEKSLDFVQNLQHDVLKDVKNPTKIIADLLNSKNKDKFITKPDNYSSYLKLNAEDKNCVEKLDELIDSGNYSKLRYDAQYAIKRLMRKMKVKNAISDKTSDLEKMYTSDRANFLKSLVKTFAVTRKTPKEETKAAVVKMYETVDAKNAQLRRDVLGMFKNSPVNNRAAEIIEMQNLFNKIDNNEDAKTFVQKAISKDLRVRSIAELNEVLEVAPLKKANIFFNNAKRIIEKSTGEERKNALVFELENPFFESKNPKAHNARMIRMFDSRDSKENFLTRAFMIIENKINQYRYRKLAA